MKKITEEKLRELIEQALNEKFSNDEIGSRVEMYGGLDPEYAAKDIRANSKNVDIRDAQPIALIDKKVIRALENSYLNFNEPLNKQILVCRDCAIVVNPYSHTVDMDYQDKMRKRREKFRQENPDYPLSQKSDEVADYRRRTDHMLKQGHDRFQKDLPK